MRAQSNKAGSPPSAVPGRGGGGGGGRRVRAHVRPGRKARACVDPAARPFVGPARASSFPPLAPTTAPLRADPTVRSPGCSLPPERPVLPAAAGDCFLPFPAWATRLHATGKNDGTASVLPRGPGLPDDIASWKSYNNILLFSFLFNHTRNARGRRQVWVTVSQAVLVLPGGEVRSKLLLYVTCLEDQVKVPGGQLGSEDVKQVYQLPGLILTV